MFSDDPIPDGPAFNVCWAVVVPNDRYRTPWLSEPAKEVGNAVSYAVVPKQVELDFG